MRILMLTQWFQPEPFFKGLPFAKALQARGHDVEVLTGFPNYPGGKVYSGYHISAWKREVMDGITVHRVALFPSHDNSGVRRILNYLSFGISAAFIGPFLIQKPDVVYVYNLPSLCIASHAIKLFYGSPSVYDIQDLWPDSVISSGMMNNFVFTALLKRLCRVIYKKADHIVTLSPGFKIKMMRQGNSNKRISVLYNWCDEANMQFQQCDENLAAKFHLQKKFVVMFAGTMGVAQGLDIILDVAEKIARIEKKIRFVFVGGGVERARLIKSAKSRNLKNVIFMERQPPEAMSQVFALADVMLVHLKDKPLYRITIPSKIQAYMAAGKPVLCAVKGDAATLVQKAKAGVIAYPEDLESISDAVLKMSKLNESQIKILGSNARNYYLSTLSMQAGVKQFESIFFSLKRA